MNPAPFGILEAMMRRALLGAFLFCVSAGPVAAQVPTSMPTVDSGLVVRAWLDSGHLRGRLLQPMRADADSVRYCRLPGPPCDGAVAARQVAWLPHNQVRHLDVQVGNRWKKGAWIGGISGAIVTFGLGSFAAGLCDYDCPSGGTVAATSLVVGGVLFGSLGALIGSAFPRFERRF